MTAKTPSKDWWLNKLLADTDYLVMSEAAATLKVSVSTLRRLKDDETLKAPSQCYEKGGYKVYLYTPDDIRELRKHFGDRIKSRIN